MLCLRKVDKVCLGIDWKCVCLWEKEKVFFFFVWNKENERVKWMCVFSGSV